MKKIFAIDWIMIITFVPSICSGIGLHIAGHGTDHEVWHNWAVLHVFSSLLFLVAAIFHIKTHWSLYRSSVRSGMGHKSPVTAVLSVVFVFVVVTGVVLLGIEGAGSSVGVWHYRTGIVVSILSVGHLLKRISLLRRGSTRK
ncbi:MAG: hypothetical protein DBX48_00105 [Limosilactobacillus fermentum]|jgi:hypothetical protein|nr:MAG: hypothetical protein DBX48_00105 [Limosilactobacillus fermentum]